MATAATHCVSCHGADLGGAVFIDDPAVGLYVGSNLTTGEGGVGDRYTDEELARAIRYSLRPDGRPLLFMPAQSSLSDEDLAAIIAYIRSVPPVDRVPPSSRVGPLARVLHLSGKFPLLPAEEIDRTARPRSAIETGPTIEYGEYLISIGGCRDCHGASLTGGPVPGMPPGTPPATDLTSRGPVARWSDAEFIHAMRTGLRPDGSGVSPIMPWPLVGQLTDDELTAILLYIRTVEPGSEIAN